MKTKTKRKLIKLLKITMILFAVLNIVEIIFGTTTKAFAVGFDISSVLGNGLLAGLTFAFGGLPLIIITVVKLGILVFGLLLYGIMSSFYSTLATKPAVPTLKGIIFSGTGSGAASDVLSVNFFNIGNTASDLAQTFRGAVAKWYYILRLISAAILLVILIYVGIRMALSSAGQEQAKYKQMLTNWVMSVALLFLLHYIILFIINVNMALVKSMAGIMKDDPMKGMLNLVSGFVWAVGIEGIFAAVLYVVMVGQIFSFFLMYLKRMITVGFLIMISPLICITYSIDKMGDGKAQALNNWLKELSYNILIQPFHAIIYLAFMGAVGDMIKANPLGIGAYILAIIIMKFMKQAEEILRKIFHFDASSMGSLAESGQAIANARGRFVEFGKGAATAVIGFNAAGGFKGLKEARADRRVEKQARRDLKTEFKENGPEDMSFRQYLDSAEGQQRFEELKQTNARQMKEQAEAEKQAKAKRKYDAKYGEGAYDQKIEDEARKAYDAEHGEGNYDRMKRMASKKNKYGQPTNTAQRAQSIINNAQDGVKEDVAKQALKETSFGNTKAGKTIHGFKTAYGNFSNSRIGKMYLAGAKDSTKVAAAIALGGFAYGATGGDMQDAISAGQLGYGLADGTLSGTSKTVANDATDKMKKYMEVTGKSSSDISKEMNSIEAKGDAGLYKELNKQQRELINEIAKLIGSRDKAMEFVTNINYNANQEDAKMDLDALIDGLEIDDPAEKRKIQQKTKDYTGDLLEAKLYSNIQQMKNAGGTVDILSTKVEKKVEKYEKVIEQTQNANVNMNTRVNVNQRPDGTFDTQTDTRADVDGAGTTSRSSRSSGGSRQSNS